MKKWSIILAISLSVGGALGQTNYNITQGLPLNLVTSTTPTPVTGFTTNGENSVGPFNIGFDFKYFGITRTSFYIGSNGILSFNVNGSNGDIGQIAGNIAIPSSGGEYIAFANSDLNPGLGTPTINYFVTGSAPNRILVVNFTNVRYQSSTNTDLNSVQIQLYEGASGKIELHNTINKSPTNGFFKTIGINSNVGGYYAYTPSGMNASTSINLVNTTVRFETCSTPYPIISPQPTFYCTGGTLVLSATCSVGTLSWGTGETTPSISVMPTAQTSYSATCTNGCTATASVFAQQGSSSTVSQPTITKTPNSNIFAGTSVMLSTNPSACPGGTITWGNGLGTGQVIVANPLVTTTYTATCTLNGGCTSSAASITVNVERIKVNAITPIVSCSNNTLPVDFSALGSFTNPNFTVKLRKSVSVGYTCSGTSGTTDVVVVSGAVGTVNLVLPANLESSGSSQCGNYYGPQYTTTSYFIEVSNGTDISAKYPVTIGNTCNTIYKVYPVTNSDICFGTNNAIAVSFVPLGVNPGNTYTVELSNVGGTTFPATPIVVGSATGNTLTSIPVIIPANAAAGRYNLRVSSSNPVGSATIDVIVGNYGSYIPYITVAGTTPSSAPVLTKNPTADASSGTTVALSGTCNTGSIRWEDNSITTPRNVSPSVNTIYSATCVSGTSGYCASPKSSISVNIAGTPIVSPAIPTTICAGGSVSLTAARCESPSVVMWYVVGNNTSFATGLSTIVSPPANTINPTFARTTEYYATCVSGGVASGESNYAKITALAPSISPTAIAKNPTGSVSANSSVTLAGYGCAGYSNYYIVWEDNSILNPRTVNPATTTTYSARCAENHELCPSASVSVVVNVTGPCPQTLTLSSTNNPTDDASSGTILKQANAATGNIAATNKITGTANVTYQAKSIQLNPGFRADGGTVFLAQVGGCN